MRFALWVAQKIRLQAYSNFKYMKLKSYDKKIYIFIPNIFLTTLKVNKCQRVYLSLKSTKCKKGGLGGTKFQKLEIHVSRPQHFLYLWTGAKAFQKLKKKSWERPYNQLSWNANDAGLQWTGLYWTRCESNSLSKNNLLIFCLFFKWYFVTKIVLTYCEKKMF